MGKDTVYTGSVGSGKTLAYIISTLSLLLSKKDNSELKRNKRELFAVVAAHSRELAESIYQTFLDVAGSNSDLSIHLCVGGNSVRSDMISIKKGVDIVVGSLGRIHDMQKRACINLSDTELLIIDDANTMLSDQHTDNLKSIFQQLPKTTKVILPSSLFDHHQHGLIPSLTSAEIIHDNQPILHPELSHYYVQIEEVHKADTLLDLLQQLNSSYHQCVIQASSRRKVDWLSSSCLNDKFHQQVRALHGDLPQADRTSCVKDFTAGKVKILIAPSGFLTGMNLPGCDLLINYDLPPADKFAIHSGVCGRYGKPGVTISLLVDPPTASFPLLYPFNIQELPENLNELFY